MDITDHEPPPFWRSRGGVALLVVVAVGGFLLFTEHRAHVLGVLPFAFLLACPLMHVFMHHGHHQFKPTERDSEAAFGDAWRAYAVVTPRFIPHFSKVDRARPVNSH